MLNITSLNGLDICLNDASCLEDIGVEAALLLIYLAEAGSPQQRIDLAHLFWPYEEFPKATSNLRSLLMRLQRQGLDSYLVITATSVDWAANVEVTYDVEHLRYLTRFPEDADLADLQAAVDMYTHGFLQGVDLAAYPTVSSWVQRIAAELAHLVAQAKAALAWRSGEQPSDSPHTMFGRQREAAQLRQFLDAENRLISIIGMGGTGKTFFVRSQMAALQERYNNEVYFVDLRNAEVDAVSAEDAILRAICVALPMPPSTSQSEPLFTKVVRALRDKPCCLILDNFETVIDAAILLINLIQATPYLTLLVTSRTALFLANESRIYINGLSIEDRRRAPRSADGINSEAVGFFVHCARRNHPRFALDSQNLREIRTICRLVDGVPLAIELAALQLDLFSLSELRERLNHGIDVLVSGDDELPGNHHSMTALLDGMWHALDPDAQRTLAELSVFASTWHREAMQSVVPARRIVYETLRNTAMMRVQEPAWFSMHPMIRKYAAEKLRTDYDPYAPAYRHAIYFLSQLALDEVPFDWTRLQSSNLFYTLQRTVYDLEVAWRWAVAHAEWQLLSASIVTLSHFYILSGQAQVGSRLLTLLLEALPPETERTPQLTQLAGRAALFLSHFAILYGDLAAAKPWIKPAVSWLDVAGTPYDQAIVRLHWLWRSMQYVEEMEAALALVPAALELTERYDYPLLRSKILAMDAHMHHIPAGNWEQAIKNAHSVLTANCGLATFTLDVLVNTASILCICMRQADAATVLAAVPNVGNQPDQSAAHFYESSSIVGRILHATLLAERGDLDAAIAQIEATLPLYLKHYAGQASLVYGLQALCLARRGDLASALESARLGLAQSEKLGGHYVMAYAQLRLAEVLIMAGQTGEALSLLKNALASGLTINETTVIFSALYSIVLLRKDELPRELYELILKIGAVSPAMYYEMHTFSEANLRAEGIILTQEERERLYYTDLAAAKALVEQVGIGV